MKFIEPKNTSIPVEYFAVEDPLLEPALERIKSEKGEAILGDLKVTDIDEYFIDGGGIVSTTEPEVEVELVGCKFKTFIRQLEEVIPALRRQGEHMRVSLGDYVFLQGAWTSLLLTYQTAGLLADLFERAKEEQKDRIEEEWGMYYAMLGSVNSDGLKVIPRERKKENEPH